MSVEVNVRIPYVIDKKKYLKHVIKMSLQVNISFS